jgi:hypothetical protein
MLTLLALQHRDAKVTEMAPTRGETSAIMAVSRKLIGILTSAVSTLPVDLARLDSAVP